MNILVTGATGLVGAEVIRQAITDPQVTHITALARRPLTIKHPKLDTIIHDDFTDYGKLHLLLRNQHACLWCLGISQLQVTKEQYHIITYDYAVAAARAMHQANPAITFLFVSGGGADTSEKSRTLFARIKGKTENALQGLGLRKLYIARPGGIKPVHKNPNTPIAYKMMLPLYPLLELIAPSKVINSVQLAKAMLYIVKTEPGTTLFENKDLKAIASHL